MKSVHLKQHKKKSITQWQINVLKLFNVNKRLNQIKACFNKIEIKSKQKSAFIIRSYYFFH